MSDRRDSRDGSPRTGSPLWAYLNAVTVAGLAVTVLPAWRPALTGLPELAGQALPWVIAGLALMGELRPIVTPGKTGTDCAHASVTFCFAALLYWGFPVAALTRSVITLAGAALRRTSPSRALFSAAQYMLSLAAAGLAPSWAGIHPRPLAPWTPGGGQLPALALAALAYFAVNFLLVGVAVAIHARAPAGPTLRRELPYQAFASLVLLAAAPLAVLAMGRSVLLVLLFLLPLAAVYANTTMSLQREHQVHHDELTGLPNRTLLLRRTADAMAEADRTGRRAGFLLLDLDRFKEVNDTLGHPVGDCLLKMVAHRLAHSVRPGDVVARLGGDEFAVLLPAIRRAGTAREVAARLRAALAQPVHLGGMTLEVDASVGVALYPDHAAGVELLMQRADVAMYLAKERHTGVETYACDAGRNSAARLSLLGDLRRGIDRGELELHYQPKVSLSDGLTCGMEALVRWRHPRRGMIVPGEFIPAAEQSCLMHDLTAQVLAVALGQARQWRRDGLPVQVCVNLAARDLLDTGLAGLVEAELDRHGLAPGDLLLEINERMLAGEPAPTTATVDALAARGIPISLDDFGTGQSSLMRLRRLPVTEIKVDASFVTGLYDCPGNELIVKSLVKLVRALGIRSVAEGVESAEVAAGLAAMGCDAAQGWYFGGPLDPAEATEWLASHRLHVVGGGRLLPQVLAPKARLSRSQWERLPRQGMAGRASAPLAVPRPPAARLSSRPGGAPTLGWLHAHCP